MATYEIIVDSSNTDQKVIRKTESVATNEDFTIASLMIQIEEYRKIINAKITTHNILIDEAIAAISALKLKYTIPYSKITAIE